MCRGVVKGLAFRKFSGSVKILGAKRIKTENKVRAMLKPRISLIE